MFLRFASNHRGRCNRTIWAPTGIFYNTNPYNELKHYRFCTSSSIVELIKSNKNKKSESLYVHAEKQEFVNALRKLLSEQEYGLISETVEKIGKSNLVTLSDEALVVAMEACSKLGQYRKVSFLYSGYYDI